MFVLTCGKNALRSESIEELEAGNAMVENGYTYYLSFKLADSMLNKYSLSDNAFEHKKGAPVGKMWYNTYYLQPMQWYVNNQYEEGEH